MIISGILLMPDNQPWRNQSVRIISVLTAPSVLQSVESGFVTDNTGAYSIEMPIGKYRVSVLSPVASRGFVDIGIITITPDTPDSTINNLILAQATIVPRDPLIDEILQIIADFEASGGGIGVPQTFVWTQNTALVGWTIPHNLKRFPSVTVVDDLGQRVEPDVGYVSNDIVQITFGSPFAGKAYLN